MENTSYKVVRILEYTAESFAQIEQAMQLRGVKGIAALPPGSKGFYIKELYVSPITMESNSAEECARVDDLS